MLCDLYVALSNICYGVKQNVLCDRHVVICKMYFPTKMWFNVLYDENVILEKMCYLKQNVSYDQNVIVSKMCYLKLNLFYDQNVMLRKMCYLKQNVFL